jgi:hypothetical protein
MSQKIGIPHIFRGKKTRAIWISHRERDIWCCAFSGFETDRQGFLAEIEASDEVIRQQPENSLLVAVDLYKTKLGPEIEHFFRTNAHRTPNPIRKMAVLYLSEIQKLRSRIGRRMPCPSNTRFFDDYERAKDWLVGEGK